METRRLRKLHAMGVPVWRLRQRRGDRRGSRSGRIRLEAGSGRWLLVVDEVERARYDTFLGDLMATLGPAECRFGTWSDSPDSGVGPEDWIAHGIEHVLVAGAHPGAPADCVGVASLAELSSSASERRRLWARLRERLGR